MFPFACDFFHFFQGFSFFVCWFLAYSGSCSSHRELGESCSFIWRSLFCFFHIDFWQSAHLVVKYNFRYYSSIVYDDNFSTRVNSTIFSLNVFFYFFLVCVQYLRSATLYIIIVCVKNGFALQFNNIWIQFKLWFTIEQIDYFCHVFWIFEILFISNGLNVIN